MFLIVPDKRLILAWDENMRYNGTEEDECLIGMAICDRRSESLEQENRQYSQAPPDNIVRYEWGWSSTKKSGD